MYGCRWKVRRPTSATCRSAAPAWQPPSCRCSTAAPSCGLLRQGRLDCLVIAERQGAAADDLAAFVALTSNQQHVAAIESGNRATNRLAPVADLAGARRCFQDRGADRCGIFAARVV